jgi:hypothetical protein
MRRGVVVLVAGLALAFAPAAGALTAGTAATTKVAVTPGTGGTHTRFRFSFRMPTATGLAGGWSRVNMLSVDTRMRSGCVWEASSALPRLPAGRMMRVSLNPSRLGGSWCTGTFHGEIVESQRIICSPLPVDVCPQLVIAPQVLARFKFRVTTTA